MKRLKELSTPTPLQTSERKVLKSSPTFFGGGGGGREKEGGKKKKFGFKKVFSSSPTQVTKLVWVQSTFLAVRLKKKGKQRLFFFSSLQTDETFCWLFLSQVFPSFLVERSWKSLYYWCTGTTVLVVVTKLGLPWTGVFLLLLLLLLFLLLPSSCFPSPFSLSAVSWEQVDAEKSKKCFFCQKLFSFLCLQQARSKNVFFLSSSLLHHPGRFILLCARRVSRRHCCRPTSHEMDSRSRRWGGGEGAEWSGHAVSFTWVPFLSSPLPPPPTSSSGQTTRNLEIASGLLPTSICGMKWDLEGGKRGVSCCYWCIPFLSTGWYGSKYIFRTSLQGAMSKLGKKTFQVGLCRVYLAL